MSHILRFSNLYFEYFNNFTYIDKDPYVKNMAYLNSPKLIYSKKIF